jgi:hypothetical protein
MWRHASTTFIGWSLDVLTFCGVNTSTSEHRGWQGGHRRDWASLMFGPLQVTSTLSEDKRLATRGQGCSSRPPPAVCLYCELSQGIDRYDSLHRLRLRHRQHGSHVAQVQLHEG